MEASERVALGPAQLRTRLGRWSPGAVEHLAEHTHLLSRRHSSSTALKQLLLQALLT